MDGSSRRSPEQDERYDARARTLFEQIPAVVYLAPPGVPDLPAVHVSPQIELLLGYTPEEWTSDAELWFRSIHPDDRERVLGESARVDVSGEPWEIEYRLLHRDGSAVWVHDRATIRPAEEGVPLWHGIMVDVTRAKEAEEARRASEHRYRTLVEQVPAVVYLVTNEPSPRTLFRSPQVEQLTGFTLEELGSSSGEDGVFHERIVPEDLERVADAWSEAVATEAPFDWEYRFRRKGGELVWFRESSAAIRTGGGPTLRQGVMVDITRSKLQEEELRESEGRYRALVENVPAVVYILAPDGDGTTLYVSPHVEHVLGYTRQEWLDQPDIWMELLHPDDRERVLDDYDRANETGEEWSSEYRLIADDGRIVWFRDRATLVRDDHGLPRFWHGVRMDITELKVAEEGLRTARDTLDARVRERTARLEEANEMMMLEIAERKATELRLRQAEEKYRGLVEQIPGAVAYLWEVDPTGTYADAYTSPAIEQLLGYTIEEWHRPNFYLTRVHPDDYERLLAAARHTERTGDPFDIEVRYLHKDGHVVWVHEKATLLTRDAQGAPRLFNAVMMDVTARKSAEERVRAAEDRQRALLEHIPGTVAYVWECGSDGGSSPITYTSPQLVDVLGFTVEEWHARPGFWRERVHPDDREELEATTHRCEETGEPFAMEYRFLAKDGRIVWVLDQAVLVERNLDGSPWLYQGVFFDLTERKRYEQRIVEAEQRYRTLVEQIPAIVYMEAVDQRDPSSSRIVFVSPQVEHVLGYTSEELVAEPNHLQRLIHPDDWPAFAAADRRAGRTGSPFSHVYRAIAKDGSIVWLQSKASLIRDEEGRPRFWHGIAIDVTPRSVPSGSAPEHGEVASAPADAPGQRRTR